jgi:shikimate kinase
MKRIRRRHDRPLLKTDDPGATLQRLIEERYPVYALADITVQSREVPHERIVDEIVQALAARLGVAAQAAEGDRVS